MKQKEDLVLATADHHHGKHTSSFDPDIYKVRMTNLIHRVIEIKKMMSGYEFERFRLLVGGDTLDGFNIYPSQPNHQAILDPRTQARDWAIFWSDLLLEIKDEFPQGIEVDCSEGNHARFSKFMNESTNLDKFAYDVLADRLRDKIKVNYAIEGDGFIRPVEIRGHKYILYHGHDIRMYQTIPWYGIMNRMMRWYCSKLGPFEAAFVGHFHSFGCWRFNGMEIYSTGTAVTDDEWALQTLGMESSNKWWLLGVSDKRPVTFSFGLEVA